MFKEGTAMNETFRKFASKAAEMVGSAWAFIIGVVVVVAWAAVGPFFGFSDTWQLVMSTGASVLTFLMVFLVQNTQNRDAKAVHLKLNELLRAVEGARTNMVLLETLPDDELAQLQQEFQQLGERLLNIAQRTNTNSSS